MAIATWWAKSAVNLAAVALAVLSAVPLWGAPPAASPATAFIPDPASVTREGPGWRYPQAGWYVVHIEGTPYERGYQHGRLLAAEIVDYIESLAAIKSPKSPHEAWRDMRTVVDALFLRRYDKEYLEEMKGIADGAASEGGKFDDRRLDLIDIVAINSEIEHAYLEHGLEASANGLDRTKFNSPQYSQPKARPHEHCSAFVAAGAATPDGRVVIGHITMSELQHVGHYNVWLDIQPARGHRVVMQTFPGGIHSGFDYYINDGGLVVSETTIHQTKFNPNGKALASRIRKAVQYADSIDQAVEILGESSNGLYTNQWLLADIKTNEIAMFELGTDRTRLWRSSRDEWFAGTNGFYWGCNNGRDVGVAKETVPDLSGKPANLVSFPKRRDKAWLALFERHRGKIGEAFAREAFSLPPLAAFPSCDAKFTTSELAKDLKSWALFGPPLGRTWDPTPEDRKKYPGIKPLVSNDWALLSIAPPPSADHEAEPVDLDPFPDEEKELPVKFDAKHPFAWRGTLLPKTDGDVWLAAAFAEYEKIVAFENSLKREVKEKASREKHPTEKHARDEGRDLAELALFEHESKWLVAARRLRRDIPLREIKSDPAQSDWYDLAEGKGVMLLAALRGSVGSDVFDRLMDEFGQDHAGREVTADDFVAHFDKGAGKSAAEIIRSWLNRETPAPTSGDPWTIYSFEIEPERSLIVYGTLADRAAQKEAASLLARAIARRFSNYSVPIKADTDVDDADLNERHLLLIGRPATNRVTARCAANVPVSFGRGSFTVRGETHAHSDSALIIAGDNPINSRFSVVIYAGLGANATWKCVQHLDSEDTLPPPQVLLMPAGRKSTRFRVTVKEANVAQP